MAIVAKWLEALPRGEKILAVADSNVAADNLTDKLRACAVPALRVGDGGDERLQEEVPLDAGLGQNYSILQSEQMFQSHFKHFS